MKYYVVVYPASDNRPYILSFTSMSKVLGELIYQRSKGNKAKIL